MKRLGGTCVRRAVLWLALALALAAVAAAAPARVWPLPQHLTRGAGTVVVDGGARLAAACGSSPDLTGAFERFRQRTFARRARVADEAVANVSVISVCAWNVSTPLQLGASEAYRLAAGADGITVECEEIYGCYHGLETLSQLISFNHTSHRYELHGAPLQVKDFPRFQHRGVLVDTSRHFIPVHTLYEVVDSMTYAKLNVLHWHITDAHSFPMESVKYPRLAEYGAYSPAERFSVEDMKDVRDYARARGVRVMMEFDSPAHTAAMCAGMPELCPLPQCGLEDLNAWVLDITKERTHTVVKDLFHEIAQLFPDQMMHIGGDEVVTKCWEENENIMNWLKEHNKTVREVLLEFTKGVEEYVSGSLNRMVVGWEEMWSTFGTSLDKKTVIQQWLDGNASRLVGDVTSNGYRALVSVQSSWYLNWDGTPWNVTYSFEPCDGLADEQCKLVLGGEACLWSEFIDASVELSTMWPRAAAVAERLWSRRDVNSVEEAEDRYAWFRCLLNQRGVGAGPAFNGIARRAPHNPGSCYVQ